MNKVVNHTYVQSEFEKQYLSLRGKEGRIYSDEQVGRLPLVSKEHPLSKEWRVREFSAGKLFTYLKKQKQPLNILEVGCGNGWLSNQLTLIPGSTVTGIDVNKIELEQAKRVFQKQQLQFIYGDIRQIETYNKFNVILFAASVQYFPSLPEIVRASMKMLEDGGEIHIIDTYLYGSDELTNAVQRSKKYFNEIGFPMMEHYYFHHSLDALDGFSFDVLYDPESFTNRLMKQSPFPWIRIKKC